MWYLAVCLLAHVNDVLCRHEAIHNWHVAIHEDYFERHWILLLVLLLLRPINNAATNLITVTLLCRSFLFVTQLRRFHIPNVSLLPNPRDSFLDNIYCDLAAASLASQDREVNPDQILQDLKVEHIVVDNEDLAVVFLRVFQALALFQDSKAIALGLGLRGVGKAEGSLGLHF